MADAKKKVDEAGAKGAGEGATMTPAEPTGKPEMSAQKPEKAPRLTRSQVVSQHAAQGGKCYVSGKPLGDDFVEIGGKLVCRAVNDMRGGRSLGDLRTKLATDIKDALKLIKDYGGLVDEKGVVVFGGERPAATEKTATEVR